MSERKTESEFDRLAIKKFILDKAAEENSEIPHLSYSHLEIVDPETQVDERLVEEIDNGNPDIPLSDELFFECLTESPDYLAYEPFRRKIKQWQERIGSELTADEERRKAKDNLKYISKTLLANYDGRGRPSKYMDFEIYHNYQGLVEALKPFLDKVKDEGLDMHRRPQRFEKEFPSLAKHASLLKDHTASRQIAKEIIIKKYGVSKRRLNTFLTSTEKMIQRTREVRSTIKIK